MKLLDLKMARPTRYDEKKKSRNLSLTPTAVVWLLKETARLDAKNISDTIERLARAPKFPIVESLSWGPKNEEGEMRADYLSLFIVRRSRGDCDVIDLSSNTKIALCIGPAALEAQLAYLAPLCPRP